jgi:hypothetical protein
MSKDTKAISIKFLLILAAGSLAACSDQTSSVTGVTDNESAKTTIATQEQNVDSSNALQPLNDDPGLNVLSENKFLRIKPYKMECEGFYLTQCYMVSDAQQSTAHYFYDQIEGFNFEWGYSYELLVRVTSEPVAWADASDKNFSLVEIISQSQYLAVENFDYIARYADNSISKIAPGTYELVGGQLMTCESEICASIDSALEQNHSALLSLQYGELPGDSLKLLSVDCVESPMAFNDSCLALLEN